MAFCPQCGKSVAEQASKCLACGHDLATRAKAARFKGTMMMTPGTAAPVPPRPAPPAAAAPNAGAAAKQPPAAATAPAAAVPPPPPSKVSKATILGTGGAGLPPPSKAASAPGASALNAPPPAAGPPKAAEPVKPQVASASRAQNDPTLADTAPNAADDSAAREDSQRLLVGDPMAPPPKPATRGGRSLARGADPTGVEQPSSAKLVAIAIGGVLLIAAVGYATARYMGLVH